MSLMQRIDSIESGLTLDGDYAFELAELESVERDFPVYRHMGTPVWKMQDAREKINRIREWIREELSSK